jgi:hypothetical protein
MNQPTCLHYLLLCYDSKGVLRNILASFNYDREMFSPSVRSLHNKHIETKQASRHRTEL